MFEIKWEEKKHVLPAGPISVSALTAVFMIPGHTTSAVKHRRKELSIKTGATSAITLFSEIPFPIQGMAKKQRMQGKTGKPL
jgi:hypothetical protein